MFEISEEFRKLLHNLLSNYSVGDVLFGVLKTFYEDNHVLYDEIIDELSKDHKDHMSLIETALKQDGIYVFIMHIIEAADAFNNLKNIKYVDTAFWFDRHVSQIVFDKLMEISRLRMRSNITIEGIPSNIVPNFDQLLINKINEVLSEYGFKVTKFETPPMRFLNKEEYDEYMKGGLINNPLETPLEREVLNITGEDN